MSDQLAEDQLVLKQKEICTKFGVEFFPSEKNLKVGITPSVKKGITPINGLRHPLEGDTTGWYIWAGNEFPLEPDAFVPIHVRHLPEWSPFILKYLGLPPGWRFQIDQKGYEDVWKDNSILDLK